MNKKCVVKWALLSLFFLGARLGQAAVFNIPNGDIVALKNAISAANSNGQPDIINLAANGTYTLTSSDNSFNGPNGLPVIMNDVAGLDLTINGNGATIGRSDNPGTPEFRILQVASGGAASCDSLTIANGMLVTGAFPANRGGGIFLLQATLTLTNCNVRNHTAQEAGGILNFQSTLVLNGCTISLNAAGRGGGIWNIEGTISGSGSTFSDNAADGTVSAPGVGGAILNGSSSVPANVTLTDCQFLGNRITGTGQGNGGAICNQKNSANAAASVALTNCTFDTNFGADDAFGGAIANSDGKVTVIGGTLRKNYGRYGGAIHQTGGQLEVRGATLEQNSAKIHPVTTAGGSGGGIFLSSGTLMLADATLLKNGAGYAGGGVFNSGTATISNCDFNENTAAENGGGIRNHNALTLVDSRLVGNTANSLGGGVMTDNNATLMRCIFNGNSGSSGAGLCNRGNASVESSTFQGNATGMNGFGGGIETSGAGGAVTTLLNSTLSSNTASRGGGISMFNASLKLLNCTLSGNNGTVEGGGLHNRGSNSSAVSSTFAANNSPQGDDVYNANTTSGTAVLILRNNVFTGGTGGINLFKWDGTITSEGHNISSDAAGGDGNTGPGGHLTVSTDIRNTNPNLGPLQNNGGPTLTHVAMAPSAAIDSGDDDVLQSPFSLTNDQRGVNFPRRIGAHVDRGAVETGASFVVTTTNDHNDGVCNASDCTLREAIAAVNAAYTGNINFAPDVRGTIQLGAALPEVSGNLYLQGPSANLLTVRRNGGGDYRIFTISNGTVAGPSVVIKGLTITNGRAPSGTYPDNSGGGILNFYGTLSVGECAVIGNNGATSDTSAGGGILNFQGSLYVTQSAISGNTARFGGGIASSITTGLRRSIYVHASTISGNSVQGGDGGGIYSQASGSGSTMEMMLGNCTLSGNSASPIGFLGGAGGSIFNYGSFSGDARLFLEDCTIADNNASNTAGIYNNSFSATASLTLRNTILKNAAGGGNLINSSGNIYSLGHNLSDDAAGGLSGSDPGGYLNATGDVRETDPLLGPLQDNGGPTQTHALLTGSPAINFGENTSETNTDQRGYSRFETNDIGAFEFGGSAPQSLALVSAVSRKTHGGTGSFDVALPGIECRSGGATGAYMVIFTFSNPLISVTDAAITGGTGSVSSGMIGSDPHQYIVSLSGVTNAQSITITLTDLTDFFGNNRSAVPVTMGVLLGDISGNGAVSATDVSQTKLQSGQAPRAGNFRADVNASGSINATDISQVKLQSGTGLP